MRGAGRTGRTVVLRLRFDDFTRATRSHTLVRATAHTQTILGAVRRLVAASAALIERRGLTLVGVAVGNLDDDGFEQLELPFDAYSDGGLDGALDAVRDRFGSASVIRAARLGRDRGLEMPMLPD
jgi:DNA polymerase-4